MEQQDLPVEQQDLLLTNSRREAWEREHSQLEEVIRCLHIAANRLDAAFREVVCTCIHRYTHTHTHTHTHVYSCTCAHVCL